MTKTKNRWFIAIMGTLLQVVLGTVYAWSFFQNTIIETYKWSNVQTMWIFSLAILFLGLSAAVGGIILPKYGPRKLATLGAILYGLGYMISAYAMYLHNLPLFYIGFGVIGGTGLGLGYVTPVATASKWFPDKKGFITGMVVMGFGLGALFMSKVVAPLFQSLTAGDLVHMFLYMGIVLMAIGIPAGLSMQNPPENFVPKGYTPSVQENSTQQTEQTLTVKESILSTKFLGMWIIFFLNISAGIMFISLQSPMIQDLLGKAKNYALSQDALVAAGGTLIAVSSLFNGFGRFLWGGLSDRVGRIQVFRLILGSQLLVFTLLMFTSNPWIFGILVCYVLLCYGGGFGSMPSYVLDVFSTRLMPIVYGAILTAWSLGGIIGPQIAAYIRDIYQTPELIGSRTYMIGAILLGIGFIVSLTLTNKPLEIKRKSK